MEIHKGLEFQKFDLHVHTPASYDFDDKDATPKDIVKAALSKGLRGIAISDHGTGEWIDKVKEEAKGTNLVVFPGVEISCSGGKSGLHIIAIFDTDKTTKHVEALLTGLDIRIEDLGTERAITKKSAFDVIKRIAAEPLDGIAILAHCTSSKGVMHDITGLQRTKLFENFGLYAVESSEADFNNEQKIKEKKRIIDFLSGSDPNYFRRKVAVIICSDSKKDSTSGHSIAGIGSAFTYLKTDDAVTLESLRQCFLDRDVRVRQHFEEINIQYPYIKNLAISSGFFEAQSAKFHKGLNSILGGKGAGKSLLVELLRFALSRPSQQEQINNDHERKLETRLQQYGKVELEFEDETGSTHQIARIYNSADDNPYELAEQKSVVESFSILFLSQNEIVKIAEDEKAQLNFIDQFFDFRQFAFQISSIEKELGHLDKLFANSLRAAMTLIDIEREIDKRKNEVNKLDRILSDKTYDSFKKAESKKNTLDLQNNEIKDIQGIIELMRDQFEKRSIIQIDKDAAGDALIKRNQERIKELVDMIIDGLRSTEKIIQSTMAECEVERTKWQKEYIVEKRNYQEYIRKSGGSKREIEKKRQSVNAMIKDLEERMRKAELERKKLRGLSNQREIKIRELIQVYAAYSKERKEKCRKFEDESNGRLKIVLHESSDKDYFKEKLRSLKRGSYLRDSEIDDICNKATPFEFIQNLLRYQTSQSTEPITKVSEATGIDIGRAKTLFDFLLGQFEYEELLKLQYLAIPQDRPEIKYQVKEGEYSLIRDISVGQKCTAMLIMALSDGNFPVIIDQPEDSLDVRTVWEDMCEKLRAGKDKRQFIFTTHNSSLAVASDSDKFIVIESDANRGKIEYTGAIDTQAVKEEAIKYLEGGRITYSTKANKYGYRK